MQSNPIASVVSTALPVVIQAFQKGGFEAEKDFGGAEKFWGSFNRCLRVALPNILATARSGGAKSCQDGAAGDDKFWEVVTRIAARTLGRQELTKDMVAPRAA